MNKLITVVTGLSLCVVVAAILMVGYLHSLESSKPPIRSTQWESVEKDVLAVVSASGYGFMAHAHEWKYSIPAIKTSEYDSCLSKYAALKFVKHDANFGPKAVNRQDISSEYMFKYNQITKIQMLKNGISCANL